MSSWRRSRIASSGTRAAIPARTGRTEELDNWRPARSARRTSARTARGRGSRGARGSTRSTPRWRRGWSEHERARARRTVPEATRVQRVQGLMARRPHHAEAVGLDGGGDHPPLAERARRCRRAPGTAGRDRDRQSNGGVREAETDGVLAQHPRARGRLRAHGRADREAGRRQPTGRARARPRHSGALAAARWSSASRCTSSREGTGGRITVDDVEAAAAAGPARGPTARREPRARSRRSSSRREEAIARRKEQAASHHPTFVVTMEINGTLVVAFDGEAAEGRRRR